MPSTPGDQPMPSRRSLRLAQQAREEAEQLAREASRESESAPVSADAAGDQPLPDREPEQPARPAASNRDAVPAPRQPDDGPSMIPTNKGGDRADLRAAGRAHRRATIAAEPPREKRSRKGAWGCLIALVVILALLAGGAYAVRAPIAQLIAAVQGPEDFTEEEAATGTDTMVMIHAGDSGSDIAATLVDEGVVKGYTAFYKLLLAVQPEPVFQPGAYQLKTRMTAESALDRLLDPASKLDQTVVIPEGTAADVVLESIAEGTDIPLADLQAAAADPASFGLPAEATTLEGFLFPATYTFSPGTSAQDALKTMVDRQFTALDSAGVAPEKRWTTIVLASLIQREAGLRDDYYKVSRVFLNRLNPELWESGLLQSDATVAYGTGNTHLVTTTDAERNDAGNLYNTYAHPGLPIGPISNPGDLAIDAALHPADGPWLFFVTWNLDTGETIFSSTVQDHDAAVVKWQDWMRENR